MTDYISRADAVKTVIRKCSPICEWQDGTQQYPDCVVAEINALPSADAPKGDLISRQWLLEVYGDYIGDNGEPKYHVPLEVVRQNIKDAPSADADGEDLIIKGAKGIQDGLYNIKDGKLFKYKANGGTVRTYPIVPSADAVHGEWVCKEREYNDCDGHYAYYWYECSVCGARPPKNTWKNEWHSNYCPSCGARMKGGDDE